MDSRIFHSCFILQFSKSFPHFLFIYPSLDNRYQRSLHLNDGGKNGKSHTNNDVTKDDNVNDYEEGDEVNMWISEHQTRYLLKIITSQSHLSSG